MLNESLCDCAVNDLQRFVAPDCYLDTPEAYLTFARNILAMAQSLTPRMTTREREAAQALNDMALYEICNRSIYGASPQSLTADQERELWGRLEVFRRSALVYAHTINDAQLIKGFEQPLEPPKNGQHGPSTNRKPAATGVLGNDNSQSWDESAREIADQLFDLDTNNNCRDSLRGYSKRVMEEMQKRKIYGPRGLIDNPNTIMREALQSEKWWAKKKK